MQILRKLAQVASTAILKLSLLGFATFFALTGVLASPDNLKGSLEQSGIYSRTVDAALNSAEQDNPNQGIPFDQPEIRTAANSAFAPQSIQGWTEGFIDGVYGWLEGNTDRPEFVIDISQPKQQFIQGIADYAGARLQNLPACSRDESLALARQGAIDPFRVMCRPPVNVEAEKSRLITELSNSEDFLGNTRITDDDLPEKTFGTKDGRDNPAPTYFQTGKRLPGLLLVASLLAAAGVVLLSENRRRGVKRVGVTLIGSGLLLAISTLIFAWLFNNANSPGGTLSKIISIQDEQWQTARTHVIDTLFRLLSSKLLFVAAVYVILGGAALVLLRVLTRHKEHTKL